MNWCWQFVKIFTIAIPFIASIVLFNPDRITADLTDNTKLEFLWAFGAIVESNHAKRLISVRKDIVLHSGDRIKFFINTKSECFIYLFLHNAQGELLMLLPSKLSSARILSNQKIYIPGGDAWFKLDEETGAERFFLLASTKRLKNIESLYRNHLGLTEWSEIESSSQSILTEIKNLKRKHRTLTAAAERPMRLGGNFRGFHDDDKDTLPDISQIAVEISALKFYSRTFTIDHQ